MSIQGKLARVIEANRIGGIKAYGEYEYNERSVVALHNTRIQKLMQESIETGKKLRSIEQKEEGK
jgi:hypothetical protein